MLKTITIPLLLVSNILFAQYDYAVSSKNPFGKPNPDAPVQIKDYEQLIGICDCQSTSRNPDQTWAEPIAMTWTFKYIMNGMGIQDETLKADGRHSGSIRQYNMDSARWYVHYFSSPAAAAKLPTWEGVKQENGNIILYKPSLAPNGAEGFFRLTFSKITSEGFNWVGEWVDTSETVVFPTWKINCKKRK